MNKSTIGPNAVEHRYHLPDGWRWVRLREVCELNPHRPNLIRDDEKLTTFIPMSAVDEGGRGIRKAELKPFAQIRKGYTFFCEGDVLFAKITPCMQNGKHAVARDLSDGVGYGSTEFHVLRPGSEITSEWIHQFILQPWLLQEATAYFTGAVGQQRVPESYLAALEIPLPPLSEQKRIAAILTDQTAAVERARAAAEAQLEAAKALPAAYIRSIFNSHEAQRWPRKRLGDMCEIVARQVDPKDPTYGALPHVNGENIMGGVCRLAYLNTAAEEGMTSGKYLFDTGDILYSKLRPYLRKVVVVDFPGVCSADMYPIKVNLALLDPHFTAWVLVSDDFTRYADEESRRARMPKLNRDQLFAWNVPLPPLSEQQYIVAVLSEQMAVVEQVCKSVQEQLDVINKLPATILQQAFTGRL